MKLQLNESGIRNIRQLAKQYNKAWIYFHLDTDGICSALGMKAYLEQYGIQVTDVKPIQYGAMEYSIVKTPDDTLPVLVDFSHGKLFMKIHTDHHESQIQYPGASKNFTHSKSNAGTISASISPTDIFSKEDVRVIDMVDSAGYSDEGIGLEEVRNYIFNWNKDRSLIQNHIRFGLVVSKLLGAFKNKPGFLKNVIMNSKPSLVSIFNNIVSQIKENGWSSLKELQHNADWYSKNQENNVIPDGTVENIENLKDGENTVIGNTIVQFGGGNVKKSGAYDRFTAFKLHPEARFYVIIWPTIGMMQVSKNNWNKVNRGDNINLGDIVLRDIFVNDFAPKLNGKKYDISLLALKKTFEKDILSKDLKDSIGFDFNEFKALFKDLDLTDKQRTFIEKAMSLKPQDLVPNENDSEKKKAYKEKVIRFLNDFTIPLPEIIMKSSGGHPGITNLTGFDFLNTQRTIFGALKNGRNPYAPLSKDWKPDPNKPIKEKESIKIMKQIATAVVKRLNSLDNKVTESVDEGHDLNLKIGDSVIFKQPSFMKGLIYNVTDIGKDEDNKFYTISGKNKDNYESITISADNIGLYCDVIKPADDGSEWVEGDELLNETKPSRYLKHLDKDTSFANISASRSNPLYEPVEGDTEKIHDYKDKKKQEQSKSNNEKTKQLLKDIKDMGLSYVKTYGAWHEQGKTTKEKSFLIPNITKEQALELGKKYGQYSVIYKDAGEDTAYMLITLDNENFGNVDGKFDMSSDSKFSKVNEKDDELKDYTGYTGLKPNGHGYNLSYKWKD